MNKLPAFRGVIVFMVCAALMFSASGCKPKGDETDEGKKTGTSSTVGRNDPEDPESIASGDGSSQNQSSTGSDSNNNSEPGNGNGNGNSGSTESGNNHGGGSSVSSDPDFLKRTSLKLGNNEQIMQTLGEAVPATDVEDYEISKDGGLIYNPISQEAKKTGVLNKYKNAAVYTGTLSLNGIKLKYSVPKNVTAYDAVPVTYELTKNSNAKDNVHVSVTTYEESARTKGKTYFDNNMPNNVSVDFEYLGYVGGTFADGVAPVHAANITGDKQGTQYPNYTAGPLTKSGTLKKHDLIWFKFKYTNSGDTIWDSDGNGTFCFVPELQKKNGGSYATVKQTENIYQRLYDTVYPGESGEFWVPFFNDYMSLDAGDYRIVLKGILRNSRTGPDWNTLIWHGYTTTASTFDFSVTANGANTTPNAVAKSKDGVKAVARNSWMRTHEEFMSSYESFLDSSTLQEKGTIYVQPCPWSENVTIKLIYGTQGATITQAVVPVKTESSSIKVNLNTKNNNYIVKDDGTRYPMVLTQVMADMRSNVQRGPYADQVIINDIRDMTSAGINTFASTNSFHTDIGKTDYDYSGSNNKQNLDAFKFAAEVIRATPNVNFEGFGLYPFSENIVLTANSLGASFGATELPKAAAKLSDYLYKRYGDLMWRSGTGNRMFVVDDTLGWMRIDLDTRYKLNSTKILNFDNWLTKIYGSVSNLNKAYGSRFESIKSINPQSEGTAKDNWYTYFDLSKNYYDWSKAMTDFDIFRSLDNAELLKGIASNASSGVQGNTKIILRHESGMWLASGINPKTTNARYRHAYYSQRREALIGEIMAASGVVYGDSDYVHVNYRPSEVAALTKRASEDGIVSMPLPHYNRMKDVALNSKFGEVSATTTYNTASLTYGAFVSTCASLFQWSKAIYENGGVPGVLWQDYLVDCFVTSTQYKELKFFKAKLDEALSTSAGKKWAKDFKVPADTAKSATYAKESYTSAYIKNLIKNTRRVCIFEDRKGI